jgi:hypothetical protein
MWKFLTVAEGNADDTGKYDLGEIITMLESEELKNYIEDYNGFYFLKGRRDLVGNRIGKDKNSIDKYKIAENVTRWLRFMPFVRMISITGTVAMKNCEKSSDVDFFVTLEKGRIFTGRLFLTAMVHLLGQRRYAKKIKNRICLNYFVATGSLEIKKKDLFAANEYSFLYPLFGFETYQNFGKANVSWVRRFKPNYEFEEIKPFRYVEDNKLSKFLRNTLERLINSLGGDRIELWLKRKQIARIERNPLTQKEGAYIEYSDENLVFLPEPQGPKILERFKILTSKNNFL